MLSFPQSVVDYLVCGRPGTNPDNACKKYVKRATAVFENVIPALAKLDMRNAPTYLDIGCGNGSISALMAQQLLSNKIYLIDGTYKSKRMISYNEETESIPWNDVRIAKLMVKANVAPHAVVFAHYSNPNIASFPKQGIDLITSFRSWGHHYPVSTYTRLAAHTLAKTGLIVLDIRNRKVPQGIEELTKAGFRQVAQVPDHSHKCVRLVFAHK